MTYVEFDKDANEVLKKCSLTPGLYPWRDRPDGSAVIELEDDVVEFLEGRALPGENLSQTFVRIYTQKRGAE